MKKKDNNALKFTPFKYIAKQFVCVQSCITM